MTVRRLLVTAALLSTAALTLTACDGDTPPAPAATTSVAQSTTPSTPSSPGAPTVSSAATNHSAAPTKSASPKASGATATPAADCTARAQRPGHKVIQATAATTTGLTAAPTRIVCGPDVPNDGYYETAGAPGPYTFASGTTAELVSLGQDSPTRAVPLAALVQHLNDCAAHRNVLAPYDCYGGTYDVTLDASGRITRIVELYHP